MYEFIMRYWLEFAFTGTLTLMGIGLKKIAKELKTEKNDQQSIKIGVQAILRDRLIQSYNFHLEIGCCSIHDRDNIVNMYAQYHKLGANGVMDGLVDEILALPVKTNIGKGC